MGTLRLALWVAALLVALPTAVFAHAGLVSSEPAEGSELAASPSRIRLVFSEPLEPALSRVWLVDGGGRVIQLTPEGDPRDVHAVIAAVEGLAPGGYRVAWRIVSADGHPVEGSYTFTLLGAAGPSESAPVAPPLPAHVAVDTLSDTAWGPQIAGAPVVPSLLRGLAVGALMALAGLLLFAARDGAAAKSAGPLAMGLAVAAPGLLLAHLAAWLANASPDHTLTGAWLADALASGPGKVELLRTGLALLALWALALARRLRLAALFALAAVLVSGATGHAMAISPALSAPIKAVHLLAVSVWMGGLLWLAGRLREPAAPLLASAARVSSAALAAVLLVTLSGVAQTVLFLPSLGELFHSAYGLTTLAKVAGLVVLLAFGAHHKFRVLPRLADPGVAGGFRGSVRRELGVMFLVVLMGGLLAYLPPPDDESAQPSPPTALSR